MLSDAPFENWKEEVGVGVRMGPADADVVIAEFMDFTCPYCRAIVPVLDTLQLEFPGKVAVVFLHYPLGRPGSETSATAAECADREGRFENMYRTLYRNPDALEEGRWEHLATEAGLADVEMFSQCIRQSADSFPRIVAGRELGRRASVSGTPTIWINGRAFRGRRLEDFRTVIAEMVVPPRDKQ
jgi:protein-disulfide isomerase